MTYRNVYPNTKKWSVKPVFYVNLHIPMFKANRLLRKGIIFFLKKKKTARLLKPGAHHKAYCGWAIWRIMNLEPMTVAAYSIVFLNEYFYLLLYASFAIWVSCAGVPPPPHYTHCGTSNWVKHSVSAGPNFWYQWKCFIVNLSLVLLNSEFLKS